MSSNPLNLTLRFLLELAGLVALGYWGQSEHQGIWRVAWGVGLPLAAAILWGTFRIPGDPGKAPVAVPGPVRLLLEIAYFVAAVTLLAAADQPRAAAILGILVIFHYLVSYDRVRWMLSLR